MYTRPAGVHTWSFKAAVSVYLGMLHSLPGYSCELYSYLCCIVKYSFCYKFTCIQHEFSLQYSNRSCVQFLCRGTQRAASNILAEVVHTV